MPLSTALYGRTSKDDPKAVTIDIQKKLLRDWSERDQLVGEVVGEYWDDGVSGKFALWERPEGKRLLADVKAGKIESIAVVYADRFGRTLLDGLQAVKELEGLGVKLVAINDGWDARRDDSPLYFQFRMMMAEEEHRRIAKRMLDGKLRAMERDKAPPGGPLVFGYQIDEHGRFVPDPIEAVVVKKVFEMARACFTNAQILRWVVETGVPAGRKWQKRVSGSKPKLDKNHTSARWHFSKIRRILTNRVYIGERTWGKHSFECEPLVDRKTFDFVQVDNKRKEKARGPYRKTDRLLSGLFVCAHCGARYYFRPHKYKRKDGTTVLNPVYACKTGRHNWRKCKSKVIGVAHLDAKVWSIVSKFLEDPTGVILEAIATNRGSSPESTNLRAQESSLIEELIAIKAEFTQLWDAQKKYGWSMDSIAPKLTDLNIKQRKIENELADTRQAIALLSVSGDEAKSSESFFEEFRQKMKDASEEDKFDAVRLLWGGGTITTIGEGHQKRANVTFRLKWKEVAQQCPLLATAWFVGTWGYIEMEFLLVYGPGSIKP